ncbi:hypothetical protein LTR95_008304 [Oleoguttula sp. CCFEE 5521]
MATAFDVKVDKIVKLGTRVKRCQTRIQPDNEGIAALEAKYASDLRDATATRTHHELKLRLLNQRVGESMDHPDAVATNLEGGSLDILMSDAVDETETLPRRRATNALTKASDRSSEDVVEVTGPSGIIHEDFPTVVQIDGVWQEITCMECGCNSKGDGSFLKGLEGIRNHYCKMHRAFGRGGWDDVARYCTLRVVSDVDAGLLSQGRRRPPRPQSWCTTSLEGYPTPNTLRWSIIDRAVVELTCAVCGTNAGREGHEFLKGLNAFKSHFAQIHKQSTVNERLTTFCNVRSVSRRDQELMRIGLDPMDHDVHLIASRIDTRPQHQNGRHSTPQRELTRSVNVAVHEDTAEGGDNPAHGAPVSRTRALQSGLRKTVMGGLASLLSDEHSDSDSESEID